LDAQQPRKLLSQFTSGASKTWMSEMAILQQLTT